MLGRAVAFAAPLVFISNVALAEGNCPPGSYQKNEDGFGWCQPTVCIDDTQCEHGQVCREYSLCMKVGDIGDASAADGGARLFVTQACAAEKRCPTLQTCSTMGRCFSPQEADRLGIMAKDAGAPAGAEPAKKSACGCGVVGTRSNDAAGLFGLAGFGLAIIALRARARRRGR